MIYLYCSMGCPKLTYHQKLSPLKVVYSAKSRHQKIGANVLYFGARYNDSDVSVWLSVDPMSDRFLDLSPYIYCYDHPVNYVDNWGLSTTEYKNKKTNEKIVINDGIEETVVISDQKDWERLKKTAEAYNNKHNVNLNPTQVEARKIIHTEQLERIADFIRNTLIIKTPMGWRLNPFYKAEAISGDLGILAGGAETDVGAFLVLAGEDKGKIIPYHEVAGGGSTDASVSLETGRIDVTGNINEFNADVDLDGERYKGFLGAGVFPVSISGAYSVGEASGGRKVRTYSISAGIGVSLSIITVGFNKGEIKKF